MTTILFSYNNGNYFHCVSVLNKKTQQMLCRNNLIKFYDAAGGSLGLIVPVPGLDG